MSNEIPDFFTKLFNGGFMQSESDILSMYIDGKISKEEFIERMNHVRCKQSN